MRREIEDALKAADTANHGQDKVVSLDQAIREHVRPQMSLYVSRVFAYPYAAVYEVARQFRGHRPAFTLITLPAVEFAVILLHGGLLKKVCTAFFGNGYPSPGPHWLVQKAFREGSLEIECGTNLGLSLRLMAGALGIGFMPTNSIIGSGMEENETFRAIDDPFGSGRKVGALQALNPDVCLAHAWAADRYGNAIFSAPGFEDTWGIKASKRVVLTVEHLVSTDFIREHADRVTLPGFMVSSVSEVPYGAHPYGMNNRGLEEFTAYGEDYDFRTAFTGLRDEASLAAWIDEWVFACKDHPEYLRKLGDERLEHLRWAALPDSWKSEFESLEDQISTTEDASLTERMIIAAGKKIGNIARARGYKVILAGVGASNLAAWGAHLEMKRHGADVDLLVEVGMSGYTPRPGNPYMLNFANLASCTSLSNFIQGLGVYCGGAGNSCLGVLSTGQVDRFGNANSTRIGADNYLTGSGGANDVASSAAEVVTVMAQSKSRFVDRVPYVTYPGDRVKTLVSTRGIFEKLGDDPEFTLTEYFAVPGLTADEAIRQVRDNCGWELKVADGVRETPAPTRAELVTLRCFDPNRYFTHFLKGEKQ